MECPLIGFDPRRFLACANEGKQRAAGSSEADGVKGKEAVAEPAAVDLTQETANGLNDENSTKQTDSELAPIKNLGQSSSELEHTPKQSQDQEEISSNDAIIVTETNEPNKEGDKEPNETELAKNNAIEQENETNAESAQVCSKTQDTVPTPKQESNGNKVCISMCQVHPFFPTPFLKRMKWRKMKKATRKAMRKTKTKETRRTSREKKKRPTSAMIGETK